MMLHLRGESRCSKGFKGIKSLHDQVLTYLELVKSQQVRADVNEEIEEAKKGEYPPTEFLWRNTYKDGLGSKMRPMEIGQEKIPV